MALIDDLLKRRSVRRYKDENIPKKDFEKILQAGLLAPTSRNRKPCNFLIVENKKTLEKLHNMKEKAKSEIKKLKVKRKAKKDLQDK